MKRGKKRGKKPTNPRAMERANENASFKRTSTKPKKNASTRPARPGRTGSSGPAPTPDRPASGGSSWDRTMDAGQTRMGGSLPSKLSTVGFGQRVPASAKVPDSIRPGMKPPVTTAPVGSPKPVDASPTTPTATRKGPSARAMERANPNASFKRAAAGVTSNPKPLKTGQPVKKIKPAKMARGGRI